MSAQDIRTPSPGKPTLLDVLQRENPRPIDMWDGSGYENTKSKYFDRVRVVKPWTDFNYRAILLAYGDLLDQRIETICPEGYRPPTELTETPRTITHEAKVDTLGNDWCVQILRGPIKGVSSVLRSRLLDRNMDSNPIFAQSLIKWKDATKDDAIFYPDWVSYAYYWIQS
ncbi:hypothetical protein VTH06DRAFT_3215 [Thermothelomyces fergusii]